MRTGSTYNWSENTFWRNITERKHKIEKATLSGKACRFDEQAGAWRQDCTDAGCTLPALLQSPHAVVDVTDRGLGIYPLPLGGRYFLRPSFSILHSNETWNTHPQWDVNGEADPVERSFLLAPGAAILTGTAPDGLHYEVRTYLPQSFPFIVVELTLQGLAKGEPVLIVPELLWMPGTFAQGESNNYLWLQPEQAPIFDEVVCRNNSTAADPQRPDLPVIAGIGAALAVPAADLTSAKRTQLDGNGPLVVGDQLFQVHEFERMQISAARPAAADGALCATMILGLCESPNAFAEQLERWQALGKPRQEQEKNYWTDRMSRLRFTCPSPAVGRQARYSLHNSLFSRSFTDEGRTIFIHGRRDRGYGDCSKIHQSYQMYTPALASGEGQSVCEELLAYAALQDARGDVARQPRPGRGWHPYVGLYSTANYLMAVHRYLCWTADDTLLDETVDSLAAPGERQTVLESVKRGADWLLANRWEGVVAPCGWVDAWPAGVKAMSQISITTYMALDQTGQIFERLGRSEEMKYYNEAAEALRARIMEVFYNPGTGLFAEYLFEDGAVAGDHEDDFWSVTQIWAALAGLAPDTRGLDLCKGRCLTSGIVMYPETVLQADYMLKFTDDIDDLPIHAVATYGLAAWPELTHLYAIAEAKYHRPDLALEALIHQLPATIHASNPYSSPTYYAEKFLFPYNDPWQCTWGGDPTFIQLLLEGFMGVHAGLDGLVIEPRLPQDWKGAEPVKARFCYRGDAYELTVDPAAQENWILKKISDER